MQKVVEASNREAAKSGAKPLRTSQEAADGHIWYMLAAGDPNPLAASMYQMWPSAASCEVRNGLAPDLAASRVDASTTFCTVAWKRPGS